MTKAEAATGESHVTASTLAGVTPERVAPRTVAEQVIPSIGAHRTDKHLYYFNGQGPVPSVTSILGIIDKPAIGVFKAKEAARALYRAVYEGWSNPSPGGEDEAILWALKEADKARDTAAEIGSSVHLLADLVGSSESGSKGWQLSEVEIPYVRAYEDFLGHYGREAIVSSEHMVWSTEGYAGTYDLIMQLPHDKERIAIPGGPLPDANDLWLIDIKTSGKGPYPEWGLQLAGYGWADYIIVPGNPTPFNMPACKRFGVLHLRPDLYTDTGWRLIEYPVTERDHKAFLSALDLYLWRYEKRFTKSILNSNRQKP